MSAVSVRILRVVDPLPLAAVPSPDGARRLRDGLVGGLRELGTTVDEEALSLENPSRNPIRDAFAVSDLLARRVRAARDDGHLAIVLAGACLTALGSCSGLGPARRNVIWLDAHADFNTPETTVSGLLDGMALAALTGRCWTRLTRQIPLFRPVPESRVVMIGARDLDDRESALLAGSQIRVRRTLEPVDCEELGRGGDTEEMYVHLDLDVLDPSVGRANRLAVPGGLSAEALVSVLRSLGETAPVGAVGLTAYDPEEDAEGGAAAAALRAVTALVRALGARVRPTLGLLGMLAAALGSTATGLHAQVPEGWGDLCESSEARRFDFMVGTWDGVEFRIRDGDTTRIGRREYQVEPVLGGCGLLERLQVWEAEERTLQALLLRSLDRRSARWVLTRLDDGPTQRVYESTELDGVVYFGSSYSADGETVRLRLAWRPEGDGFRQTIHESRGDDPSWRLVEYIDFVRRPDR